MAATVEKIGEIKDIPDPADIVLTEVDISSDVKNFVRLGVTVKSRKRDASCMTTPKVATIKEETTHTEENKKIKLSFPENIVGDKIVNQETLDNGFMSFPSVYTNRGVKSQADWISLKQIGDIYSSVQLVLKNYFSCLLRGFQRCYDQALVLATTHLAADHCKKETRNKDTQELPLIDFHPDPQFSTLFCQGCGIKGVCQLPCMHSYFTKYERTKSKLKYRVLTRRKGKDEEEKQNLPHGFCFECLI